MSHKNKESLIRQAQIIMQDKLCIGQSRHVAKKDGTAQNGIYAWSTYRTYMKHICYFLNYVKEKHGVRSIEEARQYADEWLTTREHMSPYTQKMEVSALCKLYGETSKDFRATSMRHRADIQRSRGNRIGDKHFSISNNEELINFCECTGLRRAELESLRGDALEKRGNYYFILVKGKGGKVRRALVCGTPDEVQRVVARMRMAGSAKVWGKVHSNMDVHSYRREYANRVYQKYARSLYFLPKKEKYYCRGDKRGIVYDRQAMLVVSRALGHNRISIIAGHYLD